MLYVTTEFLSLSDEESARTLSVLMSLGGKNGFPWRYTEVKFFDKYLEKMAFMGCPAKLYGFQSDI